MGILSQDDDEESVEDVKEPEPSIVSIGDTDNNAGDKADDKADDDDCRC